MREVNWAGNVVYRAERIAQPETVDELCELVARAPRIRVLGSRHSFNTIADSDQLVSLAGLPDELEIEPGSSAISCSGAMTYGELATRLRAEGLALANLGSLPHISVAGSIATATHGSGDRNGNLATAVAALELVTSAGELLRTRRGDPDFDGLVVGLGAMGAVTRVTLDVEPAYEVSQRVYEGLSWETLSASFDELTAAGYSVSVFTRWGEEAGQLWVKRRSGEPSPADELFGAVAARRPRHPIPGGDHAAATTQLGIAGPWDERLPHFRLAFTPSAGEELQSEYLLSRSDASNAIAALRPLSPRIRPLLHISEIRTVASDSLWMSPQYGRDSVGIHFTWRRDQAAVEALLREIEAALEPFAPRPHWGKLFLAQSERIASRYERHGDFAALVARMDARGAFRNDWLERHVLGR
jgi:xylitol oxidase